MRSPTTVSTLALLGLLFALTGCGSPQSRIVGKWQVENTPTEMIWEFRPNGALTSGNRPGKYTFGDNKRMKVQTQTATFMYEVEFVGDDRMIWREPSGVRTELRKIE